MATHWLLLLSLAVTLANHDRRDLDVTRRDKGDYFSYGSNYMKCKEFKAYYDSKNFRCGCYSPLTFSPESSKCESFRDRSRVHYRFDRSGSKRDTYVSTVYAACRVDDICTLNSPETNTELAITKLNSLPLEDNDGCKINFVDVIHDCKPRPVYLKLSLVSYPDDNKLYLQLHRTTPLNYLEGELFLLDISCTANDAYHKKMMFKYNGTKRLTDPGLFHNIPAFDPSTCSDMIKPTTSAASISPNAILPTSTGSPSLGHDHRSSDIIMGVAISFMISMIVVVVIICVINRNRNRCANYNLNPPILR